jgi:hypothetical protein
LPAAALESAPLGLWVGVLGLLLVVLALGAALGLALARRRVRGAMADSRQLGVAGEDAAERQLRDAGYEIVRRQAAESVEMLVDGVSRPALVRVDFLVTRGGLLFAAEAKGGNTAADPGYSPTRRQLLEYAVAFDVDGVLLVDAARGRIARVEFPGL